MKVIKKIDLTSNFKTKRGGGIVGLCMVYYIN
jgi:hypothetical protein